MPHSLIHVDPHKVNRPSVQTEHKGMVVCLAQLPRKHSVGKYRGRVTGDLRTPTRYPIDTN